MRERGRGRAALAALAMVALAAAALAAPPAHAEHHFCPPGVGAGQCDKPAGVATDAESGLVFIADEGNNRVQVFDEDGGFVRTIGAGVLNRPRGISVDNDSASATQGEVFVIDGVIEPRVLRFTPAGELRLGFGWGVADGSGELQTCGPEGTPPTVSCLQGSEEDKGECQLTRRSQIAVAPGGRLYVSDSAFVGPKESEGFKNRVIKFAADGASCEEEPIFPEGSKKTINAIAVDSEEDTYLAVAREEVEVRKLAPDGSVLCSIDRGIPAEALAVEPASDRLYAGQGENQVRGLGAYRVVTIYEPGCSGEAVDHVRRFGYTQIANAVMRGLAVLPGALAPGRAGHPLVSTGAGSSPFHLEPPPPGPVIVPGSVIADPVSNTKATLGAEVNAEGEATEVEIEYVEQAICEAAEAGAGECFEDAKSSGATTLPEEGFALQSAEALFGCPDPLSEAGHPGENAYEAGECLEPETAYRFRVVASNADGEGNSPVDGGSFETGPWLELGPAWASNVGTGSARLNAEVNPLGVAVSARFQVVAEASCKAAEAGGGECFKDAFEVPAPPEAPLDFGAGEEPTARGVSVGGLDPGTTYHFRLVASNPLIEPVAGEVHSFTTFAPPDLLPCANDPFRTGPGALLPDCRGYEMVSPLDKEEGDIIVLPATLTITPAVLRQSSVSGSRLAYGSLRPFGDAPSAPWTSQYIAQRHEHGEVEEGWQSHAISSPIGRPLYDAALDQTETEVKALSPELCDAWIRGIAEPTLAPGAQEGYPNLYRRTDNECGGPAYEALSTAKWQNFGKAHQNALGLELQGVSADGETAAFLAPDSLVGSGAPNLGGGDFQLYVWAGGLPVFACVLPNGTAWAKPCSAGNGPASVGSAGLGRLTPMQGALSAGGERLFWTAGEGDGKIYLRTGAAQGKTAGECATAGAPCTIAVSAQGEALSGTGASQFRAAASDGSKAVFSTDAAGSGEDLYLARIGETGGHPVLAGTDPIAGEVIGVMGVSEDASHTYFASEEAIAAAGPNGLGAEAEAGEPNLYLYREGAYAFIGTLSVQDADTFLNGPVRLAPFANLARVGGEHAAFVSSAPLTGYDNADAVSGEPVTEVFLYDAGEEKLVCASCNPSGARPVGRENAGKEEIMHFGPPWIAAWIEGHQSSLYASRELAEDGKRLFFNSTDSLVARDTNSRADVYEWEAPGTGSCKTSSPTYSPRNEGCVDLISSGQSAQDSEFIDASPSGDDVFFATLSNLVAADYDLVDIYDARVGGGFPPPTRASVECEGEACQNPPPAPPPPAPASAAYPRSDDAVPDRCAALAKRARRISRANPARARRLAKQAKRCRRAARRAER